MTTGEQHIFFPSDYFFTAAGVVFALFPDKNSFLSRTNFIFTLCKKKLSKIVFTKCTSPTRTSNFHIKEKTELHYGQTLKSPNKVIRHVNAVVVSRLRSLRALLSFWARLLIVEAREAEQQTFCKRVGFYADRETLGLSKAKLPLGD